ncbi:MAG: zinc ABC transporter substrate-binding protein, partial [Candidatus Eisenbacteria bacterium]|nr:zinc ABC transporter substrate-binding protein [Candidatus Latescibacterota bacterium]MBD3301067.1 zinc ABC transporter substrate-binding protein [Candidatus Eisenbacteria bacterium]
STSSVAAAAEPLRIVAATNDLGAIARAVGGEAVEIEVVARPDRDPHVLEVRPSTMRMAARADLYLEVGLSLDLWSPEIVRGSRNRDLRVLDCSEPIEPLEVPTGKVDASQGDVHPEGNPHYWLDPMNGAAVARYLAEAFARADPDRAADYRANADRFVAGIEQRVPRWKERLQGASFIEYHRTWVYFADRFGVEIVDRVEPLPGIPPSARHLASLSETIRATGVPVVVRDPYHPDDAVEFLERQTGVETAVLPSTCAEPRPESYLALFEAAVDLLGREAARPADGR